MEAETIKEQICQNLRRSGPLDRIQLAMELLLRTDEDLAKLDQAITELIDEGTCERKPDSKAKYSPVREQPIWFRRLWMFG